MDGPRAGAAWASAREALPPFAERELDVGERLGADGFGFAVDGELGPAAVLETAHRQGAGFAIDEPEPLDPDARVEGALDTLVVAAGAGAEDLASRVGGELDRVCLGKLGEALAAAASQAGRER